MMITTIFLYKILDEKGLINFNQEISIPNDMILNENTYLNIREVILRDFNFDIDEIIDFDLFLTSSRILRELNRMMNNVYISINGGDGSTVGKYNLKNNIKKVFETIIKNSGVVEQEEFLMSIKSRYNLKDDIINDIKNSISFNNKGYLSLRSKIKEHLNLDIDTEKDLKYIDDIFLINVLYILYKIF